ncbi:hypothetical protein Hdeb2414_s0216g00836351 [Helianthus debilis subsp. tardiflorus]
MIKIMVVFCGPEEKNTAKAKTILINIPSKESMHQISVLGGKMTYFARSESKLWVFLFAFGNQVRLRLLKYISFGPLVKKEWFIWIRHREVKRYSLHKEKAYTRSPLFMVLTKAVHLWIG